MIILFSMKIYVNTVIIYQNSEYAHFVDNSNANSLYISLKKIYHIYSVIRQGYFLLQNNPKSVILSYKMDVGSWFVNPYEEEFRYKGHSIVGKALFYSLFITVCMG